MTTAIDAYIEKIEKVIANGRFKDTSLGFRNDGIRYDIRNIELLGRKDVKVKWAHDAKSLKIKLPHEIESDMPLCFKLSID